MKQRIFLSAIVILLCFSALKSNAVIINDGVKPLSREAIAKMNPDDRRAHLEAVKARIHEIKKTDKSQMSEEDRKALRAELKALRHESSDLGSDIVIGTGGAVVVVLVLLLSGA